MADAVVSLLVSDLLWKLASPAVRQYRLLRGLEDDISALRDTLESIQAVLQDAEVKQRKEKAVENWLKHLKSVVFEIENVFDEVSIEALLRRLRLQFQRGIKHRVRAFFSSEYNNFLVRNRIAREVKNIRKKLDAIAANRYNFGLSPTPMIVDAGLGGEKLRSRETSSLVGSSKIYGRDAEMEMITQKICNKDIVRCLYVDDVRVYAIWGMGGVGKTTLAQLVYNHFKVKTYFGLKAWVDVSSEFQIEKVTSGIIESIDGQRCKLSQLDTMQVSLQNRIRGRRFLIVLDDVWIDDNMQWEQLSKALSCGAEGSIVMVTTRSQNIGTMMAKSPEFVHQVGCLTKEDSWSLFKMFAFGVEREGEDIQELEHIGMEIVEKCKGLPLAVKALGSLMWSKSSAREWQRVKESEIWELPQNDANILPALEISYHNLLPHMKRCFAYCCMFPKGYEMPKDLLIHLWIANGFIPCNGEADLYVVGEEIFNCLVWGSNFQYVQDDPNVVDEAMNPPKQKSMHPICKIHVLMHDLMYDLARHVMRHDCSVLEPGKMLITPDEVHHLSSSCPDFLISDENSEKLRSLRSVFIFTNEFKGNINQISKHRYLRVLHLIGIGGTALPESICKLKYLRYLNLSGSDIHVLPKSIIYLQNLLVLILNSCMELYELPEDMRYMRKLVCLDIRNCYKLRGMPVGMKELVGLQILSSFIVGKWYYDNLARIGDLGDLNLLGDELELVGLENVRGLEDAKSANLKCKRNLISLVLNWSPREAGHRDRRIWCDDDKVLEGLEPNSTLKELEIRNYHSQRKLSASWMVSLINLVQIKIWYCECPCIPPLGKLPNLRFIDMQDVYLLKGFHDKDNIISPDHTLFPSLQELSIVHCGELLSLPSNFPKLEKLNIARCYLSVIPSNFPKLEKLNIARCYNLSVIPSNFPKLEKLNIEDCSQLSVIPSNFPKLKELDIDYCPKLKSFPDGLHVKELSCLTITRCEYLARRCEKDIGEDWPKISHVPNIKIR